MLKNIKKFILIILAVGFLMLRYGCPVYSADPEWTVIENFENDESYNDEVNVPDAQWWTYDGDVYQYQTVSTMSYNGDNALEVKYNKSTGGGKPWSALNAGDLNSGSNNVCDFSVSLSSSISLWVYPSGKDVDILVKLDDGDGEAGDSIDLQTLNAGTTNQWQRLTWTWDGVDLQNCNITDQWQILPFFEPGNSLETGNVYIDDLRIDEVGDNVNNLKVVPSDSAKQITLYWPSAGDSDGDLKEYDIYRATYSFLNQEDATLINSTNTLSYIDNTGLYWDTTYYYSIVARDYSSNSSVMTINFSTVTAEDSIAPFAVTDLVSQAEDDGSVTLTWTAPGNDENEGDITDGQYRIKWTTITIDNWDTGVWDDYDNRYEILIDTDTAAGSDEVMTIPGLNGGVDYYYRIWTQDNKAAGNWSNISNGATVTVTKIIGVMVESTTYYDFGQLDIDVSSIAANAFMIKNSGNINEQYSLKIDTLTPNTPWKMDSDPGWDVFTVQAVFHNSRPEIGQFNDDDVLYSSYSACSATFYSVDGSETGSGVSKDNTKSLWHIFKMPLQTSTTVHQKIRLTIGAEEE